MSEGGCYATPRLPLSTDISLRVSCPFFLEYGGITLRFGMQCADASLRHLPLSSSTPRQVIYVAALLCDLGIRPIRTAPVTAPLPACLLKTKPSV